MRDIIKLGLHYRTRNWHPVRILTTIRKDPEYPVVGLIDMGTMGETVATFTKTGCFDEDERNSQWDLERDTGRQP